LIGCIGLVGWIGWEVKGWEAGKRGG